MGVLFIIAIFLSAQYADVIASSIGDSIWGMMLYMLLAIIATVVAPLSSIPLLPVAVQAWGPITAALLSIAGWTIGAMIAFFISRYFGHILEKRIPSIHKLKSMSARIPQKNAFWAILLLRISVPVDILSYAIGLFTTVPTPTYFFATLLGVVPFAFVLSFAGTFPWYIGLTAFVGGGLLFVMSTRIDATKKPNQLPRRKQRGMKW